MKADTTDDFFLSNRRGALSLKMAWLAIRNYGEQAGLPLPGHPHMLCHACGYANKKTQPPCREERDLMRREPCIM